jgi:hypothetical protein
MLFLIVVFDALTGASSETNLIVGKVNTWVLELLDKLRLCNIHAQ